MRKIIFLIVLLLTISITPKAQASEKSAGSSAKFLASSQTGVRNPDLRVVAIENVFKRYNSPLVPYAASYVKYADKYNVDWKLLPAISGLESYFGTYLMPGSYNAYGWGGGYIYFNSWEDGINTIDKSLREDYMNKWGAKDVWQIGPIYAESPTWSVRVANFMDEINKEYINLSSSELSLTL
ncbi:glucosaminidase domain-containing protein [Patescibacteria group bacterium]|nr:glucosaminidase domain-containing protein [Patescibacteria group bacterium]